MANVQKQSVIEDMPNGLIISRGSYSSNPIYFLNEPINTSAGNKWLTSHSLREMGAYVQYQPCPEGIRDFLCYGFVPAPRTIFKGVSAIPPGMSCQLAPVGNQIDWFASKTRPRLVQPQAENCFWQTFCAHTQLDQATVLLSGGVDSAMVSAAAIASGTTLHPYHARFSGLDTGIGSDTHAARMTAKHLGVELKEITVDSLDALRWFRKMVMALDQPLGDPVLLPFYLLFKQIRQQHPQLTVLTGEGGDQLFGSWSMKPMIMRELYPETNYQQDAAYLASFHKFFDEWPELMATTLLQQLDKTVRVESPISQAFASAPATDFCNQIRWVDLQLKGLQHIVPRIAAMAKAHQLHLQHPFFQIDMIELGLDLPNALKFSGTEDKVLLKMLARSYLPLDVIERRKQGMGVPTSRWFKRGLRPLAAYWLNKRRLAQSGLLNPEAVQALRQQNIIASDGRGRRWGDRLWMLCVLESWFASLNQGG